MSRRLVADSDATELDRSRSTDDDETDLAVTAAEANVTRSLSVGVLVAPSAFSRSRVCC